MVVSYWSHSVKRVAIVGTVGIPACYGGFESLVENLTKYKSEDCKYYIFCSSKHYPEKLKTHNGAELIYVPLKANGVQSILYDIFSLWKCLFLKVDTILILGVSGCIFLPFFRLISKSKIVTNIDGLEWKREKWGRGVQKFLKLSESFAVKYSHAIVTDNEAITNYVKEEYNKQSYTIAYGGDHAIRASRKDANLKQSYALGLCRIEPENNVELILNAFSSINEKLKFVGNWDASAYGRSLKKNYSKYDNIELINPIYDIDQLYILRDGCDKYIHGHSAGGTNPSLVEMMHFGIPIFAFDCEFNRYSTNNKAFYFKNATHLNELIRKNDCKKLDDNASYMKKYAKENYTWQIITAAYEKLY
ncbi:DUF1972 domain-containing protein [Cronobacter muytjensii]|nr:DUF1972 domain-containing protein [Cronobacter muytjensii]NCH53463.1 DUF1972 domain-containing protein [Cronobacter muytjensii]